MQSLQGRRHPTKHSRGYNRGQPCLLLQAHNLAPMKSARLVPVERAKFIARAGYTAPQQVPRR
jgi:hypothetical protein